MTIFRKLWFYFCPKANDFLKISDFEAFCRQSFFFFYENGAEHRVLIRPIIKDACPGMIVKQKIKRQQSMTHLELTLSPAAWTAFIDHMFEKMQRRGLRDACTCKIFRGGRRGALLATLCLTCTLGSTCGHEAVSDGFNYKYKISVSFVWHF